MMPKMRALENTGISYTAGPPKIPGAKLQVTIDNGKYCTGVYGRNVTCNTFSKLLLNFGKITRSTGLVANL
jgi:hypothetical protein